MTPPDFSDLNVRAATNADRDKIFALVAAVLAEFGLRIAPDTTDADLRDIERNYLRRGGTFELLEDAAGNLIGTVGLFPLDAQTCELRKMYFVPHARGRGLGKYVLERTINNARRLGFTRVTLETASVLAAANHLYRKYGFRPVAGTHLAARADLAYELDLTQT